VVKGDGGSRETVIGKQKRNKKRTKKETT